MPTASILVDLITAPVRQDTLAMEKIAKVGENTLANKLVYCCTIRDGSFVETCVTSFKMAANNEIAAIHRIRVSICRLDACVFYSIRCSGLKCYTFVFSVKEGKGCRMFRVTVYTK